MKRKYDGTGVNPDMKFTPAPPGKYHLVIREASDLDKLGNERVTKNGDPMVNVKCEIDSGPYLGTVVWHNVTFMPKDKKGAGMAVHFLKVIGEPHQDGFEIDTDNWVGKTFRAKLSVVNDFKGRPKNEIAYLIEESKPAADEEIPF